MLQQVTSPRSSSFSLNTLGFWVGREGGSPGCEPGIEDVAKPVPEQVEAEHREEDGDAGKRDHPPGDPDELLARLEHEPPFDERGLRAKADEREARGIEDGGR